MNPRVGVLRAARAEWVKLRSLPSLALGVIVVAGIMPLMALIVAGTGSVADDDTVVGGSLTGATLALMAAACIGALLMAGEFTSGMIRITLCSIPRRGTLLAAKVVVIGGSLFAVGLAGAASAVAIGAAAMDPGHAPGEPLPATVGVACVSALVGVIGVALGSLLRSSAGAICASLAILLAPALLAPLFGDYERWVGGVTPTSVLEKITQTSDVSPASAGSVGGWPSLGILALATLAVVAASASALRCRDT